MLVGSSPIVDTAYIRLQGMVVAQAQRSFDLACGIDASGIVPDATSHPSNAGRFLDQAGDLCYLL